MSEMKLHKIADNRWVFSYGYTLYSINRVGKHYFAKAISDSENDFVTRIGKHDTLTMAKQACLDYIRTWSRM